MTQWASPRAAWPVGLVVSSPICVRRWRWVSWPCSLSVLRGTALLHLAYGVRPHLPCWAKLTLCPLSDVAGHAAEGGCRKIGDLPGEAGEVRLNESRVRGRAGRRLFSSGRNRSSDNPVLCQG